MSTHLSSLGQIALHVADADASERFYRDALGLPFLFRSGNLVFFDCAGVRLMLQGGPAPRSPGNTVCLYFKVPAIEPAMDELSDLGVEFEGAPQLIARMPDHELWMSFFRDPDGYLLALMEERR
ncbi:VOC family protein [Niveibacterium microcysteis]|uniref:VOC family protein n=1 Tax=Niveibacterium microcysteis TaxID=2811415 RepID=A0ABX7M6Y4_9RHOO|nr:VOC family protein [Niveibacterium microcysteis]QSI76498.1 VOC family protein [Niveibacterium microcysteis]